MKKILVISILLIFGNSFAYGDILQDSKVWKFFGKIANDAKSNFPELPFLNKELEQGILKFGSATYIGTIKGGKAHGEGVFMFSDGTKYEGKFKNDLSKPTGDLGRAAACTLAEHVLGWKPKVTLKEGLRNTYDWAELFLKRSN